MTRGAHRDAVFKAIADPTRRSILGILRVRSRTVGEIATKFEMSRPAISKHLRILHRAGLVESEPRGASNLCSLRAEPLSAVKDWLREYEGFWQSSLASLKRHVEEDEG